jgi:hypothetical protein
MHIPEQLTHLFPIVLAIGLCKLSEPFVEPLLYRPSLFVTQTLLLLLLTLHSFLGSFFSCLLFLELLLCLPFFLLLEFLRLFLLCFRVACFFLCEQIYST